MNRNSCYAIPVSRELTHRTSHPDDGLEALHRIRPSSGFLFSYQVGPWWDCEGQEQDPASGANLILPSITNLANGAKQRSRAIPPLTRHRRDLYHV